MRERATALRRAGVGRAAIARELGVGHSTVARWFRADGVELVDGSLRGRDAWRAAQRRTVEERWAHQDAEQDRHAAAVGPLSDREVLLVGAAVYWAEGAKAKPWRRSQKLVLINSDEAVVRVFLRYLRLLGVPRTDVLCRLAIHESADVAVAEARWRAVVGDDLRFSPTSLKRHNATTVRQNTGEGYAGCLCVSVSVRGSASAYRRTAGTWDGVAAALSGPSPVV